MKRPRFSLRTLAIVVSLICAYFGAWGATKSLGPNSLPLSDDARVTTDSPLPFILRQDWRNQVVIEEAGLPTLVEKTDTLYFVWYFTAHKQIAYQRSRTTVLVRNYWPTSEEVRPQ